MSLFSGFDLNNLETDTQTKFRLYCQNQQIDPSSFEGVSLHDIILVEDLFEINVLVYELAERENDTVCRFMQNSRKIYPKTMKLNLFENHFSYIFHFEKYCKVFHCAKCDVLWYNPKNYNQHIKHCQGQVSYTYKRGVFRLTPTVFEELAELGIHVLKVIDFTLIFRFLILNAFFQRKIYPPIPLCFSTKPHISLSAALFSQIFPVSDP